MLTDLFRWRMCDDKMFLVTDLPIATAPAVLAIPNRWPDDCTVNVGFFDDFSCCRCKQRLAWFYAAAGRRPAGTFKAVPAHASVFYEEQASTRRQQQHTHSVSFTHLAWPRTA